MCTKKKSNKSTHFYEDKTVKAKAQRRSVRTIGRPRSNMAEEEGSLASTESEKDTSSYEYLLETPTTEEDEDKDIDVSRKVATP